VNNLAAPGTLIVNGYGPGLTLPDSTILFSASFMYLGGTSALTWDDGTGASCQYTDGTTSGPLYDLPLSTYYINGQVSPVSSGLHADFSASDTTPPKNTTVIFTDLSTGGPTGWDWSFNRPGILYVDGTDDHSENPHVQFTDGGLYTVTLTIHNGPGSDTKTKVNYIRVGTGGLWTGNTSSDWYTATNWDNWLVPDNTTNVEIPGVATNWPVFEGNFIVGSTCKTIHLDVNSVMTVHGDLIIQ